MKRLLIALIFLSLNSAAFGTELIGGTVKHGDREIGMACNATDDDGQCTSIVLLQKYRDGEFNHYASVREVDTKEVAKGAGKEARKQLNKKYAVVALSGTAVLAILPAIGGGEIHPVGAAAGVLVDIVKAPFVAVAFVGHKITDVFARARMTALIKHMINPEKKGKVKRTRERYLTALKDEFRSSN